MAACCLTPCPSLHPSLPVLSSCPCRGLHQPPKEGPLEADVAAEADKMMAALQEHLGEAVVGAGKAQRVAGGAGSVRSLSI